MAEPLDIVQDGLVYPVLRNGLLPAVLAELERRRLPEPCFVGLMPGVSVALDYVGEECGAMLWARGGDMIPSTNFPNPDEGWSGTPSGLQMFSVEVGLIRAAPIEGEAKGRRQNAAVPPSAEQWDRAVQLQLADSAAIKRAVCGYLEGNDQDYLVQQYQAYGPEGGVVGGWWTFLIHEAF